MNDKQILRTEIDKTGDYVQVFKEWKRKKKKKREEELARVVAAYELERSELASIYNCYVKKVKLFLLTK